MVICSCIDPNKKSDWMIYSNILELEVLIIQEFNLLFTVMQSWSVVHYLFAVTVHGMRLVRF